MEVPTRLLERAARRPDLKRWERREIGQELRRLGLSYREIQAIIPAARGTLSGWCRDIRLTEDQAKRLREIRPRHAVRREIAARMRQRALDQAAAVRAAARQEAKDLLGNPLWVAGVVAYWSEGAKRWKSVKFSNSDPGLVLLFIRWATTFLGVDRASLTAALHLHSGQCDSDARHFWSTLTGIPVSQFRKTYVKAEGTGHRKNLLYNGTVSIRLRRSGSALQRVLGWIEALGDEYGSLAQLDRAPGS